MIKLNCSNWSVFILHAYILSPILIHFKLTKKILIHFNHYLTNLVID
jgi:hypothetical protein